MNVGQECSACPTPNFHNGGICRPLEFQRHRTRRSEGVRADALETIALVHEVCGDSSVAYQVGDVHGTDVAPWPHEAQGGIGWHVHCHDTGHSAGQRLYRAEPVACRGMKDGGAPLAILLVIQK
jgi:hypothetical protein